MFIFSVSSLVSFDKLRFSKKPSVWLNFEIHFVNNLISAVCETVVHVCSVAQSWPTLWDPMDCSPPGSSVHGIFLAGILEWVAIRGSSWPRDRTWVSCSSYVGRHVLYCWTTGEALVRPYSFSIPNVCSFFFFISFARYMSIWFVLLKSYHLFLFIFRALFLFINLCFLCVSFSLLCSFCWVGWPN